MNKPNQYERTLQILEEIGKKHKTPEDQSAACLGLIAQNLAFIGDRLVSVENYLHGERLRQQSR